MGREMKAEATSSHTQAVKLCKRSRGKLSLLCTLETETFFSPPNSSKTFSLKSKNNRNDMREIIMNFNAPPSSSFLWFNKSSPLIGDNREERRWLFEPWNGGKRVVGAVLELLITNNKGFVLLQGFLFNLSHRLPLDVGWVILMNWVIRNGN